MLPIDFKFDYERPRASSCRGMRTPVTIYLAGEKKRTNRRTGGIIAISNQWLKSNDLPISGDIAIQVKGKLDTYIIFNPPKNAPRFQTHSKVGKDKISKQSLYSCTEVVRRIIDIFNLPINQASELWLDYVGEFGTSKVYRLRLTNENDQLYSFS